MGLDDVWDFIAEGFEYLISFEWVSDLGEVFSNAWESISSIEDSPMTCIWFWAFYICLLAGVWVLPTKMGLADYTLFEKILYTAIFFVIDWVVVSHFRS